MGSCPDRGKTKAAAHAGLSNDTNRGAPVQEARVYRPFADKSNEFDSNRYYMEAFNGLLVPTPPSHVL